MLKRYCLLVLLGWGLMSLWGARFSLAEESTLSTLHPAEPAITRQYEPIDLPENMAKYMRKRKVPEEVLGIYVQDLNANTPLLLHSPDEPLNPASTMKLLTTWSALNELGPAWSWKTEAWMRGTLDGKVLRGDLILKGYGDPFLVDTAFWKFLRDLRDKGVHKITGDLIVDNSFFAIPDTDPGAFDRQPDRVYNAPPSALMFNFQATRFLLDVEGEAVAVRAFPNPVSMPLDNRIALADGKCRRSYSRPRIRKSNGKVAVTGRYAASCGKRFVMRLLSTPEQHVYNAFRDYWLAMGGEFKGSLKLGKAGGGDELMHVHHSRTLLEQIRLINKWSNNVMTRQVMLSLGAKTYGAPATLEKGRLAILQAMQESGLAIDNLVVENGSGLSRHSRVSARQLGQLLLSAWHSPYMPEFLSSFSLLGEDGTLGRRFRGTLLQGRSRLKTGTLRNVTALAGYMLTRSGKRMIVVIIHNGRTASGSGRTLQKMLLEWVFKQ